MNICFTSDNNYVKILSVAIISLFENNKDINDINIYLVQEGISEENKIVLENLSQKYNANIFFIDISTKLDKLKKMGIKPYRGSYLTYARLFLEEILPKEVERILYLDCDVCVVNSLKEIYNTNLNNLPLGMVKDTMFGWHKMAIGMNVNDNYYNAGVVLFDIKRCREIKLYDQVSNHIINVRSLYPCHDQDLLNIVLKNNIFTLMPQNNILTYLLVWKVKDMCTYLRLKKENYYSDLQIKVALEKPTILHLVSCGFLGRPWENGNINPAKAYWDKYLKLSPFAESFGEYEMNLSKGQILQKKLFEYLPSDVFCKIYSIRHKKYENIDCKQMLENKKNNKI